MIKIVRNEQGNCINFYGSSNPTYWNACLSGEVDPTDSTLVNIKNDIKTAEAGETQYEFFRIPFTEFRDEDNNSFANAQEVSDYVTLKGNVTVGLGVTYKGIYNPETNTPDITTDLSGFAAGDFYNVISNGTHDIGSGDVDFINGDEVIFDGTDWQRKPYAGALIEYDSTSILLNNNASVYADGAQGLEEPNGSEDGWYFKNDEIGKKINWYYLGNENAGYQMNKSTLQGGYVKIKVLKVMDLDSPFFSLYTTPKGDGFDAFWFRSRYVYSGDFSSIAVNQEVIAYWGENPSASPELARVELTIDNTFSLLSTAPDISNDSIYTMALSTNSSAVVDSLEFIAKELGYKNQQYLRSFILEAKLDQIVVNPVDNDLTGESIEFNLDATSTSIMLDNGYSYGVNTIKAMDTGDGLITIKSIQGDIVHFTKLDHTNVSIGESSVSGGLNDVINTLNELFTVGAFQSVVISDPYSTMIADVDGEYTTEVGAAQGTAIETGTDEYGATVGNYNSGGYKTPETINRAGEYFTFDIRNEGIIGFGLIPSSADYANGDYNGNSNYADPSSFCNGPNSGHYGYQFSHWFHPSPNGPWTNYGANTGYSQREGWSNATYRFPTSDEGINWVAGNPTKMKVGIDENNFIVISYYDVSTSLFIPIARTNYPVPNGLQYHLGIKFGDTTVRLVGLPKIHELEELAPTMNFRYIESPDSNFEYPLFSTEEEANYYDEIEGGTGTSHTHTYVDDPTNTTWYMPDTNSTMTANSAPTNAQTFQGNSINWTEITSLADSDLTPPAFSFSDISQEEGTNVNLQLYPAGATFSQSATINPNTSGLVYNTSSHYLQGTLADVGSDTVYTITVIRANAYGSTTSTFTITATDVPVASTLTTPWNKAIVINGANEYLMQVSNSNSFNIMNMGGMNNDVWGANNGKTSTDTDARPWSISQVVYIDNSQPQCYFSQAENYVNDRISLSTHETGAGSKIEFYWGRSTGTNGANSNGCQFLFDKPSDGWYGYYIDTTGFRPNQAQSTTSALASNFRFKQVDLSTGTVTDIAGTWAIVGDGRLNRGLNGDFYIGRESGSQSFNSNSSLKVASTLVSTLKRDFLLPDDTEISMQVRDPQQWVIDYRDGTQQRLAYNNTPYSFDTYPERCVSLWLMGDGALDNYSNNLRNDVKTADQNYTMLRMQNMVSNDIESVNINGLT